MRIKKELKPLIKDLEPIGVSFPKSHNLNLRLHQLMQQTKSLAKCQDMIHYQGISIIKFKGSNQQSHLKQWLENLLRSKIISCPRTQTMLRKDLSKTLTENYHIN